MGKPVKIRKKKSFMFTTKHHSFLSLLGVGIGVFCWTVAITLVIGAFHKEGVASIQKGAVGLFSILLNIIGIVSGVISMNERDTYITTAIAAIVLNAALIVCWLVVIFISM